MTLVTGKKFCVYPVFLNLVVLASCAKKCYICGDKFKLSCEGGQNKSACSPATTVVLPSLSHPESSVNDQVDQEVSRFFEINGEITPRQGNTALQPNGTSMTPVETPNVTHPHTPPQTHQIPPNTPSGTLKLPAPKLNYMCVKAMKGNKVVGRSCAYAQDDKTKDGCTEGFGNNKDGKICFCKADLCNAGTSLRMAKGNHWMGLQMMGLLACLFYLT